MSKKRKQSAKSVNLTRMNILLSTDSNYIPFVKALLHSLYDNNRDCAISIHLLHSKLGEDDLSDINNTVQLYNGKFYSYKIDISSFGDTINKQTRLPMETYFRLFCLDYLPKSVKKVLYLDCDIIINGSIKELYNVDISKLMFAAADDFHEALDYPPDSWIRKIIDGYLPKTYKYVNAGVLLMNIDRLRQVLTTEEIVSMIEEMGDIIVFHDQDFINYLFYKHIYHIDYKLYNYFPVYGDWEELKYMQPAIIHFGGFFKPWKDNYFEKCESFIMRHQGRTRQFVSQAKELYDKYAAMAENSNIEKMNSEKSSEE